MSTRPPALRARGRGGNTTRSSGESVVLRAQRHALQRADKTTLTGGPGEQRERGRESEREGEEQGEERKKARQKAGEGEKPNYADGADPACRFKRR